MNRRKRSSFLRDRVSPAPRSLLGTGDGVPSGVVERVTRINYVAFGRGEVCSARTRKETVSKK